MDMRRIVGMNVRRCRLAAGLSQEELAARMGVEQYYVSGLESGRRNPTITTLGNAAQALGVKAGQLFDDGNFEPRPPIAKRKRPRRTI